MKPASIVAVAGLLLAGCGGKDVTAGTIISRQFEPGYTYYTSICHAYDSKTFACTLSIQTPEEMPDEWVLCLRDDTEDRPVDQRDTGCVSVSETDYGRYSVGGHYP